MKTAFIIAEYNPFHNGHQYHIEKTKEATCAQAVVAVMSGNFVQRGDIAIGEKHLRAEAAVRCGVDLVVELPVKYAVSNAVHFAQGAVKTIDAFGMEGVVSFGASSSLRELERVLLLLEDGDVRKRTEDTSRLLGKTFPAALDAVLRTADQAKAADVLSDPNNVLALEYLKALSRCGALHPFAVERILEKGHLAAAESDGFAAATYIRKEIYKGLSERGDCFPPGVGNLLPESAVGVFLAAYGKKQFPSDRIKYDVAAYSRLLCMNADDFAKIDNVSHGLENRIVHAIRNSASADEAVARIKSKRYTMARLRQIFTAAVLGIGQEDAVSTPSYLRVLAFNETGRQLLAALRSTVKIPLVTNLSDVSGDPSCARDAALEYTADKLFDLCLPSPRGGNHPFLDHPVYIKNSAGP